MGVIIFYMRRMFYASVTEDSDFNIAKMLGVKEYAITVTKNKSRNFKKVQLKNNIEKCLETDYAIKAGKIDDETAMYELILALTK